MGGFFDWFRVFHRVSPVPDSPGDPRSYHRRRLMQEQRLARSAAAARDAHHRPAVAHRIALERSEANGAGRLPTAD